MYDGGLLCCAKDCSSRQGKGDDVAFFKFPRRNRNQFDLWAKAVQRGSDFSPNFSSTVICSLHFVSGRPSNRDDEQDYVPTVFPSASTHKITKVKTERPRVPKNQTRIFFPKMKKEKQTKVAIGLKAKRKQKQLAQVIVPKIKKKTMKQVAKEELVTYLKQEIGDETISSEQKLKRSNRSSFSGALYCCVLGCFNNTHFTKTKGINFFRFPKRNIEQRASWIANVARMDENGTPWFPRKASVVCSEHFVSGKPSPTRTEQDYAPSKFPPADVQVKASNPRSGYPAPQNRPSYQRKFNTMLKQHLKEISPDSDIEIISSLKSKNKEESVQQEECCEDYPPPDEGFVYEDPYATIEEVKNSRNKKSQKNQESSTDDLDLMLQLETNVIVKCEPLPQH